MEHHREAANLRQSCQVRVGRQGEEYQCCQALAKEVLKALNAVAWPLRDVVDIQYRTRKA